MTLLLGKTAGKRLPPKHRSGQERCHRAAAFPRNKAAMRSSPALGLVTSLTSLGNAGKHQKMTAGKDTDTNRMVTRHRKYWAVLMWLTLGKPLWAATFILEFLLPSTVQQAAQGLPLFLGRQWGRATEAAHLGKLDHFWSLVRGCATRAAGEANLPAGLRHYGLLSAFSLLIWPIMTLPFLFFCFVFVFLSLSLFQSSAASQILQGSVSALLGPQEGWNLLGDGYTEPCRSVGIQHRGGPRSFYGISSDPVGLISDSCWTRLCGWA